jgi:hypothetical protein
MVVFIFKDMINKVFTRCLQTVVKQIYEQFLRSGDLFCREVFFFESKRNSNCFQNRADKTLIQSVCPSKKTKMSTVSEYTVV